MAEMRKKEIERRQGINRIRQNEDRGDDVENLPLVMSREVDYIGEPSVPPKLNVNGATKKLLQESNAEREHLRQHNAPLMSPRGRKNKKIKLED